MCGEEEYFYNSNTCLSHSGCPLVIVRDLKIDLWFCFRVQ